MKKLLYFTIIGLTHIACNQNNSTPENDSIVQYTPTTSSPDEVANLLSKVGWVGIYRPERNVYIIGESHKRHDQSVSFVANLEPILRKKGKVNIFMEGLAQNKSLKYKVNETGAFLTFWGVETKKRGFPINLLDKVNLEEKKAFDIFINGNYITDSDGSSFKIDLVQHGVDTALIMQYYRSIIMPLDSDIERIIKSVKQGEYMVVLCGSFHAIGLQRNDIGGNVIKFHTEEIDKIILLRRKMYDYLNL